jgi:hypothetical protein
MATPQPPLTPDQRLALESKQRYDKLLRNVAIGGVVVCPLVALMPPRKLDLYTFALGVGFFISADHLSTYQTGRGLVENMTPRWRFDGLPTEKARETQRIFQEQKSLAEGKEALRQGRERGEENKTIWHKLWMGDEKEGWKERRLEEERKALKEGKTYTDMIIEQIWDVWNWDKKKDENKSASPDPTKDEPRKS